MTLEQMKLELIHKGTLPGKETWKLIEVIDTLRLALLQIKYSALSSGIRDAEDLEKHLTFSVETASKVLEETR